MEWLASLSFFHSLPFGILALSLVGISWCLIGLIMGDAPKQGIDASLVQLFGAGVTMGFGIVIMVATQAYLKQPLSEVFFFLLLYALGSMINFLMLQLLSRAMQVGPNGVVWAITQSSMGLSFLSNMLFWNEPPDFLRCVGMVLLFGALILFAMTKYVKADGTVSDGKWRWMAFGCLLLAATQQTMTTWPSHYEAARQISPIFRSIITALGTLVAAVIYNLLQMTRARWQQLVASVRRPRLWGYIVTLQLFNLVLSYLCFYPGMDILAEKGMGCLCYPIMIGSCILSFSLVSIFLLKEAFRPIQAVALTVCLSGLVCMAWGALRLAGG